MESYERQPSLSSLASEVSSVVADPTAPPLNPLDFLEPAGIERPDESKTLWYKDALFYEISVRAFADAGGTPYPGIGNLVGLRSRLDYVQALGVDCIWMLPCYPSPLKDNGYDVADYTDIHPHLGNIQDLVDLVHAVHERNMRIIMDFIPNHSSDQHRWFQESRKDPDGPYGDYYVWSDTQDKYRGVRIIFCDTEPSNWTWDPVRKQYYWHRFYSSQPDLNYDNPKVHEEMMNIVRFWLDIGVDGFRVDAVPYLYQREGTSCENLPETHDFVKAMRKMIDKEYPGRLLLSEANMWPEDVRQYLGDGDGDEFHMAFHFPVMPRIFMSIAKASKTSFVDILKRTPDIPKNCQWCIFLRNHDELTLEMVTEEERQFMWNHYAPEKRMRLNLGIRRRLAPLFENDRRKIELANAILFSLPGSPILYYGDEIGMGDDISLFDRNGVRTPMQWSAEKNAGFSDCKEEDLDVPVVKGKEYAPNRVNVAASQKDPASLFHAIRFMINIRKKHSCFSQGSLSWVMEGLGEEDLAWVRCNKSDQVLFVANLSDHARHVVMQAAEVEQCCSYGSVFRPAPKDLLTQLPCEVSFEGSKARTLAVELGPYEFRWISLSPARL